MLTLFFLLSLASAPASPEDPPEAGRSGPTPAQPSGDAAADGPAVSIETLGGTRRLPIDRLAWELLPGEPRLLRAGADSIPLDEVLFLTFTNEPAETSRIEIDLRGGDRLRVDVSGGDGDAVRVRHPSFGDEERSLSLDHVRALVVPQAFADGSSLADFRARKLDGSRRSDRLFLASGEPIEGIVEAVEQEGVRFKSDALGELLYPYEKLRAIELAEFAPGDAAETAPDQELTAVARLVDGSVVSGAIEDIRPSALAIRHPVLGKLSLDLASLLHVSLRGGRCVFLSDIEPAEVEEHLGPLFVLELPHRRDQSVMGTPMRMDGRHFPKGIGVHAYSLLEYGLEGKYERFQATIGLDATARPQPGAARETGGLVVFRVYLDGERVLEAPLAYDDPPRRIDLPVAGKSTLGLEVDFGRNDYLLARDRANWADARVIK